MFSPTSIAPKDQTHMSKTAKTAAPTTTVIREQIKAMMYVTDSGMTFVGMNDNDILSLFGLGDNKIESNVVTPPRVLTPTVQIEQPKMETPTAPPASNDKPEKFPGQRALIEKLKGLGHKQKGMHFMTKETLEKLIIEKGGSTTTAAPKITAPPAPRVEPQRRSETPQKPKGGGFKGGKGKSNNDDDLIVQIPDVMLWAEFLPKKQRDKHVSKQEWMDVLIIETKDHGYIVFGPSRDENAPCPDGWMRGIKWFAQKEYIRFAD